MKRLVKATLKALWRWLLPVRRPLMRKFEATIGQSLRQTDEQIAARTRLLLNHLTAELVRQQRAIEQFQLHVAAQPRARRPASLAVDSEALARARQLAAEHRKAS